VETNCECLYPLCQRHLVYVLIHTATLSQERLKRKREKLAITQREESEKALKMTIEYEQLRQLYSNSIASST
jgi:hypothetical protein